MSVTTGDRHPAIDPRARAAAPSASRDVAEVWEAILSMGARDLPPMGLAAGDRPSSDVELLAGGVAAIEYELARRMHAAGTSGSLPLAGQGAHLTARGWAVPWARRLARAAAFAAEHASVASVWAAGLISSEHVDAVARNSEELTEEELDGVLAELAAFWGAWSPASVARFVKGAVRLLHPPADDHAGVDEESAHAGRALSFALLGDTVLVSGELPRLEGEMVMAAIDAFADRLRSQVDPVPACARRADALVELVNAAHANSSLPSRGGLPVSLSVSVEHTSCGDQVWTTSRGHSLTSAERRFARCDAIVTPVLVEGPRCPETPAELFATDSRSDARPSPARDCAPRERVAALAALHAGPRIPLAVGRTSRTATPAQRRAVAVRDRGCIIPGCQVPAEACQTHHLTEWCEGGATDAQNLVLLCWTHHRQVDLRMWTIQPGSDAGKDQGGGWPGNNGSPWTITRTPRTRWRM